MDRGLNHDEHQFIAPAVLWLTNGLLPYRDFPLFHLPNLIYFNGILFRLSEYKLLTARLLSFACATFSVTVIFWSGFRGQNSDERWQSWLKGVCMLALFITNPLFLHTAGKAWNHDIPAICVLAAILLHCRASQDQNPCKWLFTSGLCIGIAIGTRLTSAPLAVPFAVGAALIPAPNRGHRLMALGVFFTGAGIAMLPSLLSYVSDPQAFLFGNFEYPRLGLLDPANERIQKTMIWWRKLRYFAKEIVVTNWAVFLTAGVVGTRAFLLRLKEPKCWTYRSGLLIATCLFTLAGSFAPSRYQYQHFYGLIPLLMLGIAWAISAERNQWNTIALAVVASISVIQGGPEYHSLANIATPWEWTTVEIHRLGEEVHSKIPHGKVLTLAPIYAAEGNVEIYPAFATGPFGWRSAYLVAPARRRQFHMVAPDDLETFLASDPPAGILVGFEDPPLEAPLVAYAKPIRRAFQKESAALGCCRIAGSKLNRDQPDPHRSRDRAVRILKRIALRTYKIPAASILARSERV